jgi:hypothetical protein
MPMKKVIGQAGIKPGFWKFKVPTGNNRYRKYKELTHTKCFINPIIQPSLDITPIWIPSISNEVSSL